MRTISIIAVYLLSAVVVLWFLYKRNSRRRKNMGNAVMPLAAFIPLFNTVIAVICLMSMADDYFWRE